MLILKIWLHLKSLLQLIFLKMIYCNRFEIGHNVTWRNNFSLMIAPEGKVEIGGNCFFNNGCSLNANELISIGEGTLFGENVKVYDHNHKFRNKDKPIKEQGFKNEKVLIGSHCWIGSNVVILKGTYIGDNCVIGAGCVVSGIIENNTVLKAINNYKKVNIIEG